MKSNVDYSLYLVTDRKLMTTPNLEIAVEQAIKGGVTVVQLREKEISSLEFYNLALKVKTVTDKYNIPLIINDRLDIAMAVNASGLHIGQNDLPLKVVRRIFGNDKIIGVSARNLGEAIIAENGSANYLGVGAMYATNTKKDAKVTTIDELINIRNTIKIPIVVIGGINKNTIPNFSKVKIDGIAVVSAIMAEKNVEIATKELKRLFVVNKI
jgi:thiamine-phosphate pyrophosphorylase